MKSKQIFKLEMCSLFTHVFGKCLSLYCVPNIVLGLKSAIVNKADKVTLYTYYLSYEKKETKGISDM